MRSLPNCARQPLKQYRPVAYAQVNLVTEFWHPTPCWHRTTWPVRPLRLLRQPLPVLLGFRLYLACADDGMLIMWCLANPKIGKREVVSAMLDRDH
jgi:hypothetical protein